jgi:energy-coupling factor transport system substrate-specific component
MNKKLTVKDLIVAGAFAALYIVVMLIVVMVTGFIPILLLCAPLILGVVCGTIYMLYVVKVPKRGAVLILSILVGLLILSSGVWVGLLYAVLCGLAAEVLIAVGKYRSTKLFRASYCAFACAHVGPLLGLVFARDVVMANSLTYYGPEYVEQFNALTPSWIILVLIALGIIGGLIGGTIGNRLLKKHFIKAGIV